MAGSEKLKVLIIDDVEINRFTLRDIVKDIGYQPVLAENGEQALKILERFQVSLILSDVAMPVMDGYELARIIMEDPDKRDIPIIFISAFDNPQDVVKGFEIGGKDYVTKPFIREVVKARIETHMQVYENRRNMEHANMRLQASIQNQMNQMEAEKRNALYAIIRLLKAAPFYNNREMKRLSENCRTFSEALQLSVEYGDDISDAFLNTIEVMCYVRDLGMISIPTELAVKKDKTAEEMEVYNGYVDAAGAIIEDIQKNTEYNASVDMAQEISTYHREHFDGTGIKGLKGDEIPLSAQIVAIVSKFNELTQEISAAEAVDEIAKLSGSIFNPVLVSVISKIGKRLDV